MADIFNCINQTGEYPRQWVMEYITPVPKVQHPETEDDLRPISLKADLSRDYNKMLAGWLWPYIKAKLDPGQCGGQQGESITYYLILLFHFILGNTDRSDRKPKAVITTLIDFSKGFTRIRHSKVLTRLADWGVPGWILRVLSSYLTESSCVVRYHGETSEVHPLPGGGPQGDQIAQILFLVEVSDAGMSPPPPPLSS